MAPPNNLPAVVNVSMQVSASPDPFGVYSGTNVYDGQYTLSLKLVWSDRTQGWIASQPYTPAWSFDTETGQWLVSPAPGSGGPGVVSLSNEVLQPTSRQAPNATRQAGRPLFASLPDVQQLLISAVALWVPQPFTDGPATFAPPAGPFLLPPGWYSAYDGAVGSVASAFKGLFLQWTNFPFVSPQQNYSTETIGPQAATSAYSGPLPPPLNPTTADFVVTDAYETYPTGGDSGTTYPGYIALGVVIAEFPGYAANTAGCRSSSGLVFPAGTFPMGIHDGLSTSDSRMPLPPAYPDAALLLWPINRLGNEYSPPAQNAYTGQALPPFYWWPSTGFLGVIPEEDIQLVPDGLGALVANGTITAWDYRPLSTVPPDPRLTPVVIPAHAKPALPYQIAPDGSSCVYLGRSWSERILGGFGSITSSFCFDDSGPFTFTELDIGQITFSGNLYTFQGAFTCTGLPQYSDAQVFASVPMSPGGYTLYLQNVTLNPA